MGCKPSRSEVKAADPAQEHNKDVELQLLQDRLRSLFHFKVLFLGAGESGKSTIVKQLRLIHQKKLSKNELATVGDSLHSNVMDCIRALVVAANNFGYVLTEDEAQLAARIAGHPDNTRIPYDLSQAILQLYRSEAISRAYARRDEFWLLDACPYYMSHLERFCEMGWTPNEEDIVMARVRTTGIVESVLEEKRPDPKADEPDVMTFQVVDVGGQRNERKKWIHCFDDVKAILFVESLAGYNQVLFEDSSKNRMLESLELFQQIVSNPLFANTPIYLFLNKKDLFESMLQEVPLTKLFPEYKDGSNVIPAIDYVASRFQNLMPAGKKLNYYPVTGVMKRDVRDAFLEVKRDLIKLNGALIENEKKKIIQEQQQIQNQGCCSCMSKCAPSSCCSSSCCAKTS